MMAIRDHIKGGGEAEPLLEWRHFETALKELKNVLS